MTAMAQLETPANAAASDAAAHYGSTGSTMTSQDIKQVVAQNVVTFRPNAAAAAASSGGAVLNVVSPTSTPISGSAPSSPTRVSAGNGRKGGPTNMKGLLWALLDRYHQATSTKMYDVEELIDFYFHRRLAAIGAVIISYLPFVITPNQITLFGLGLGWVSAAFLYDSEFHYPFGWSPDNSLKMAALLMFFWIVSDCADGQVARLCKRGTRTGRILDGFVDGLVIAPNCLVLGFLCSNRYGPPFLAFAIFAGISLWLHAIIYDKIKNTYMENALPQSECDGETIESVKKEFEEAKAKDPYSLDSILLGIYVVYLTAQATVTSDAATEAEATRHHLLAKCSDQYRAAYIQKYRHVVRLASFMGISAHVCGLYIAYYMAIFYWDALFYVQIYFAVVLNAVLAVSLLLYWKSGMATQQPLNHAI
ncbi:hypothetical protein PINS_up001518 [Pythium insidiosum]|nr:hypothetical protein PINS_up001518 [Pythium insidiosum]